MNQTSNSVSSRGDRPQLFRRPDAADRHIDFGPSILATIDGGTSRSSAPPSRFPRRSLLWIAGLALLLAVFYAVASMRGVPLSPDSVYALFSRPKANAEPAPVVRVATKTSSTVMQPAGAGSAPASSTEQGAASIETVALAVPSAAPAASAPFAVLASVEPAASAAAIVPERAASSTSMVAEVAKPASPTEAAAVQAAPHRSAVKKPQTHVVKARSPSQSSTRRASTARSSTETAVTKPGQDNDAELLAAMLPHLPAQHPSVVAPTSPAYARRCGQLNGEAASACRLKFCNGREGTDAACPAPSVQ